MVSVLLQVAIFVLAVVASASAGLLPAAIPATTLLRAPQHDSAVIQSERLGGNFAYSSVEGHAYQAVSPVVQHVQTPVAVSYHATPVQVPVVKQEQVAYKAAPVVHTYAAAAPVVASTYAAAPVVSSYSAAPVVSSYSAPVVASSYAAAPVVSSYAAAPAVAYGATYGATYGAYPYGAAYGAYPYGAAYGYGSYGSPVVVARK